LTTRMLRTGPILPGARLARQALIIVVLSMALAASGCGSRLHIRWEARAISSITISGRVVTSERLGGDNVWGAKAVPVNPPPRFRPWLPEDLRKQARGVIGREPRQAVTRSGRTLYAYPFLLRVPGEVRIVEIRERRGLLSRSVSTTSELWKPRGYRIEIGSLRGWKWTSKDVYSSNASAIELFVRTSGAHHGGQSPLFRSSTRTRP
jgi:hypothetical protein